MACGKRRDAKGKAMRIASALLIVSGLAVLIAVNAADIYSQYIAERHIQSFTSVFNDDANPERLRLKEQAQKYNEHLAGKEVDVELMAYEDQLYYQHEPMMSYIEIPKISVKQAIYHGTAETELMAGIGHLETSSLPIGGETSHCVLLGHSGMRNARMFDDLAKLERGDEFVVWTLNEPYAYEVYMKETVTPEEAEMRIGLSPGCDEVTLITCTPYGVNTHRLLVHARRCEYDAERVGDVSIDAYVNDRNLPLLVATAAMAAVAVSVALTRMARRKRAQARRADV